MPTGKPTKMKPCKICGELFLPDKPSSKYCSKDHHTSCPVCGKDMIWNSTRPVEPCSKECKKELTRRNNLTKYGVEHPMQNKEVQEHHRQAMLDKYGVESPLQSDEIKQRAIATNREKFGVDWAIGSEELTRKSMDTMLEKYGSTGTLGSENLRAKVKNTMIERYGQPDPNKVSSIRNRIADTNLQRYGVENAMQNEDICMSAIKTRIENYGEFWSKEIDDTAKNTFLSKYGVDNPSHSKELMDKAKETCMKKYGVPYGCLVHPKDTLHNRISKTNIRIHDTLLEHGITSEYEFYLDGKFYDLFLPQQNTLIEVDPTYTHNVIGNHWNKDGLPVDYHLHKTITALEHGYRCIHIFDWDDVDKIVNMLAPKKRIFARKCTVFRIWPKYSVPFLNEFHLQGSCRGQFLHLGLVLDDILYMVMTFGKSRYDTSHDVELLRLCTRAGYTVVGGASRLFKYATLNYGLENIISYCDRSKFSGTVYEEIGMRHIRDTPPQEVWSKEDKKITANLLRQRGFDQLFNTNYGKGTSNEQLMLENGWLPVYDCGQSVFEY